MVQGCVYYTEQSPFLPNSQAKTNRQQQHKQQQEHATTNPTTHKPPRGRKTGKNASCLRKLQQFQSNFNSNHKKYINAK